MVAKFVPHKKVSQKIKTITKRRQENLQTFLETQGEKPFYGVLLHFSPSKAHVSSSKHRKNLKVAEIYVLQHPTNIEVKIKMFTKS